MVGRGSFELGGVRGSQSSHGMSSDDNKNENDDDDNNNDDDDNNNNNDGDNVRPSTGSLVTRLNCAPLLA